MKTPPELPDKPYPYQLQTGREKSKGALTGIGIFFFLAMFFASISSALVSEGDFTLANRPTERAYDSYERGSSDYYYYEALFVLGGYYFCLIMIFYSLYTYITTEISDEKPPEATMYEQEMEQYNLKLERYQEELEEEAKKQSPFYIGDGSTGSEMKNTCKRCKKIWYLDVDELTDLEERVANVTKIMGQMGNLNMATALFNPALAAQGTTTMAANSSAIKSLNDELDQKARCPECNSKNVERTLVDADNYEEEKMIENKSDSLSDQLKKLNELKKEGILDDEEFKSAKQKLIEKQ